MDQKDITALFHKYYNGTATPEEEDVLMQLIASEKENTELQAVLQQRWENLIQTDAQFTTGSGTPILKAIIGSNKSLPGTAHRVHFLKTAWFRYAAAIIILLGAGLYLLLNRQNNEKTTVASVNAPAKSNVSPGKQGAILTLADGTEMVLDSMGQGTVASQPGTDLVLKNGMLEYKSLQQQDMSGQQAYNTITTPKGRQFQIVLPDGTKVWLNAASSLRYPTTFIKSERKVEISGEAYFEVAKNEQQPFQIKMSSGRELTVLGTSFNISDYADDAVVKTTLVEGKVKFMAGGNSVIMRPGEQAVVAAADLTPAKISIKKADVEQTLAWKNGLFHFDDQALGDIMKQISRWYDVDIRYVDNLQGLRFGGVMSRKENVTAVLKFLSMTEALHFKVEGRTVIIQKAAFNQ